MNRTWKLVPLLSALLAAPLAHAADAKVDFNRDVRPFLSGTCLKCHGLDDNARKGMLRFDLRDSALKGGKSGVPAIVPGKPGESEAVKRIFSSDEDELMPPPASRLTLTDAQKKIFKQWVAEGAEYKTHWAFVPPVQVELPKVKQADWPKNAIDYFVLARLEAEGLHPSAQADRYTLARRLYLDLIGLPPTPEEADAFAKDESPDAYEKLVDHLLASPQYGERWARRWLDLARYADTNGYEKDRPRSIWPYRDWVINALNADMPFDRFTIEQLAGDMLPTATVDQKIATGFHRNTMRNEEGGTDPLEFRFYSIVDRTNVTGTTWLGMTVGCAQCHSHKFDPITQKDYYQLMAFLDNADEPEYDLPPPDAAKRREAADAKVAKLTAELPGKWPLQNVEFHPLVGAKVATASGVPAEKQPDGSFRFTGEAPDKDVYTFEFDAVPANADRIRLEVLAADGKGPGRAPNGNFVLSEISVKVTKDDADKPTDVKIVRAEADFSQKDFAVAAAIDGNDTKGWGVSPQEGKNHSATFHFQKPVIGTDSVHWTVTLKQNFGTKHTIARARLAIGSPRKEAGSVEAQRQAAIDHSFGEWEKRESAKAVKWTMLKPTAMSSNSPTLDVLPDNSVLVSGDITKSDTYDLTLPTDLKGITAVRLEALPHDSLPKHGPGMVYYEGAFGDFLLSTITLNAAGQDAKFNTAVASFGSSPVTNAIDTDAQSGWSINGGQGKPHIAVFGLAAPTAAAGDLKIHMLFERYYASSLGHFRLSVSTDARAAQSSTLPPEVEEALAVPATDRSAEQRGRLMHYFLSIAPELAEARKEIDAARGVPSPASTLVLTERPPEHARTTHIHHRGEFLQSKEAVSADVPGFLPPLSKDEPRNRLGLAEWLVSGKNPLTARVIANRQWAAFFGRGIVRTTEDFGYQGELPSHPELLDYLAVEFVKQGWSLKKLDRFIVMSSTYRQSSRVTPELIAHDPQNILLTRGPRFRVEAEIVRDSSLRSAGLLSSKIGGPSVFPPQLPSITTEGTYGPLTWNVSTGEDRYRRSLYTFSKRTAPFAMYNMFDAPTGEASCPRREVSNTPLQALMLLNDAAGMEAAQALGKSAAKDKGDDSAKAASIFRHCLTRPPEQDELTMLVEFAKKQRERFEKKELDANKVAGPGEGNAAERATWTTVARSILNLDETVTKN